MPVVISLLRGVNVGGHNKVKMEALRALYESLGLRDVQTYVQSGNLVFKTKERDLVRLSRLIEGAIEKKFGFHTDVILRTTAELRDVITRNPFAQRGGIDPSRLLITFLAAESGAEAREKVSKLDTQPDELYVDGREVYIYFVGGMARPKTSWMAIAKMLKTPGTGRNWNTVRKLWRWPRSWKLAEELMLMRHVCVIFAMSLCCVFVPMAEMTAQQPAPSAQTAAAKPFPWPNGKRAAVSLSFDDARTSQIDVGLALLNEHDVKATFYLEAANIHNRLEGWKKAVADGHEIGSHTVTHPCTGNYAFSRHNALEDYTLQMMEDQINDASAQIQQMLGVKPRTFAYPCGQKFVGRGLDVRSYVPLVAEHFIAGRGYLDESPNDPAFCDLAQAMGTPFDDMDLEHMKAIVDEAAKQGRWVIFVGHEIGTRGFQVTDATALGALCDYLKDPANGIWLATVEDVAQYIRQQRGIGAKHAM